MLEEILQKFGLSDKEAKTYIACLELDTACVGDIAKKSGINRSTTYVLLDSLKRKGFVHEAGEKDTGVRMFLATPPERLVKLAEESAKKYIDLIGNTKEILPEFYSISKSIKKKSRVRYFDGVKGLIDAYEDTLTSAETIRAYASIENMHNAIPNYFPEYYKRRANNGIAIRSIHPNTREAKERIRHNKLEARESVLVPKTKYNFSPEINIYDNKIVFMSLVEKFALIIESEELSHALKKVFELSWLGAKQLEKETIDQ